MSAAVLNGSSLVHGRKLFSVPPADLRKSKLSTPKEANAYRGTDILGLMTSHLWMRMANLSSLVSGVAVIMIVSIHLI